MADYSKIKQVMKAAALGDSERANELHDQLTKDELSAYNVFVIAMFAGALEVRFKDDQGLDAIRRFANEMQYDYRSAEPPVQQLVVEGLIRGMLGEEHLFDDITAEEQMRTQLMAIRKVVGQSDKMSSRLDDYLADAETLTLQWASES